MLFLRCSYISLSHNPTQLLTSTKIQLLHVVNLFFLSLLKGFGYLLSQLLSGYPNTLITTVPGILGTVFDSCPLHEQDLPHTNYYYNKASHTKLTVMTGGPTQPFLYRPTISTLPKSAPIQCHVSFVFSSKNCEYSWAASYMMTLFIGGFGITKIANSYVDAWSLGPHA